MRAIAAAIGSGLALLGAPLPASAAPLEFAPCRNTPDYECATLDVALDPSGAEPARLRLHVRRLVETRDAPEALVALAGGPGQSSSRFVDEFADALAEGLENRQLVVLDTRGTGASGALECNALRNVSPTASPSRMRARLQRCGTELGDGRRFYTTTETVADLEELRKGLGLERLSLFGISYGAYVAQRYARRFPEAVDSLVLDSPVAQDQGGSFDASSYAAVAPMLRRLCAGGRCRRITRDPVRDLRRLLRTLGRRLLRARVFDAEGHAKTRRLRTQAELFDLIVSSDFSPTLRGAIPAALRSAVRGDGAPLLRLLELDAGSANPREFDEENEVPAEFSNALFFATTCQEKPVPWGGPNAPHTGRREQREKALEMLPRDTFAPFGRPAANSTQVGTALCERWPPTPSALPPTPGPIDARALILSGLMDLRTPPLEARRTAARISDPSLVTVPGAGHSLVSSRIKCVQSALTRFFVEESVGNPCAGPVARGLVPALAPVAPRRLPRVHARRGHRVALATIDTVRDAARVVAFQGLVDRPVTFGGLRGGSACGRPGAIGTTGRRPLVLTLRRTRYLPGVAITGSAVVIGRRVARFALATSGPGALRARLRLRRGRIFGLVGGQRLGMRVSRATLTVPRVEIARSLASTRPRGCR